MSTVNNPHMHSTKPAAATATATTKSAVPGRSRHTDSPSAKATATTNGRKVEFYPNDGRNSSTPRLGAPKSVKSKTASIQSSGRSNSSFLKGTGNSNTNKPSSKNNSGLKSSGTSPNVARQVQSNTILEFNTPKQNQLLSHCDYADRVIWATRVLWGGNSVNGFLRATATAQRIKKQRARQNNSTKMSRAAKAANATIAEDDKKGAAASGSASSTNTKLNSSALSGTKVKEIFKQHEEESLKKEIMNPRTAKKLKSELEVGLTFCATVCNVLRGVLFDMDPSLSPSLPPHLAVETDKPPPAHTFLIPSPPPPGSVQYPRLSTGHGVHKTGSLKPAKGSSKLKVPTNLNAKGGTTNRHLGILNQHQSQQQLSTSQNITSSPGDPANSTLRRLRKTNRKNKNQSIFAEPALANLPPEFDSVNNNKRTCTKKEYQNRIFQLVRYRDLRDGDFCAARLSSRDLWILAKVLKEYKTNTQTSLYTLKPLEFLSLSSSRRDAIFQKEKVLLEDVEDQEVRGSGTHVIRSLVLPLPRSCAEANEWASRLVKKGSRVYAMYPQTTSLYAATVTDSTTYCRGDDDIIVVQFDGEDADPITGHFPSYHIPARFVTLIPREFPASQSGRAGSGHKSTSTSPCVSGTKRKSASSGNPNKKRSSAVNSDGGGLLDGLSMDFGSGNMGGFDDLDLDFDKPLDENEKTAPEDFAAF